MTVPAGPAADPTADLSARTAIFASPLLALFNASAVLSSADVHVASRLGRLCGEDDERVLLAVALAVRAVRSGSVCVRLDDLETLTVPEAEDAAPVDSLPWPEPDGWQDAVRASSMVAVGPDDASVRPARWVGGRLYLDRYWRDEQTVRRHVDERLAVGTPSDPVRLATACARQLPQTQDSRQRLAAAAAVVGRLTVLTGGPGTGKTTTVARVLAVLQEVAGPGLQVALAAPTGKAAARLQEAVRGVVATMDDVDQRRLGDLEATTIHRLLGWRAGSSTRFRHDGEHHLPHDVVIVDETSMVSLPLMARLLEALRPQARLLLVGDPDQLASVEAGAVLGDLVARGVPARRRSASAGAVAAPGAALPRVLETALPSDVPTDPARQALLARGVVRLEVVHRHGDVISGLAAAVRDGRTDDVLNRLRQGDAGVTFVETSGEGPNEVELAAVRARAEAAGVAVVRAARSGDAAGALSALESHRVLVAHRRGPAGVRHWAALVEDWVRRAWARQSPARGEADAPDGSDVLLASAGQWYSGRPLLVTRNDRDTGLFNGDTGVIVSPQRGGLVGAFGDPADPLLVRPHRLPTVETVHAMTVHRAQGSQFGMVSLVLPPATSPLLTRELFYTALTRAKHEVHVVGTEAAVRAAVERPIRRASGLRES
ncbi:MAG TPA: exodeoxyribonuclease V subunit alpha [Actinomycetales bacterium]|nr:exodeoxyribonuclease V subunit alpha [Actinomycetales bacterium]